MILLLIICLKKLNRLGRETRVRVRKITRYNDNLLIETVPIDGTFERGREFDFDFEGMPDYGMILDKLNNEVLKTDNWKIVGISGLLIRGTYYLKVQVRGAKGNSITN